jgi:tetratricopeptide (TPR) repeat protein
MNQLIWAMLLAISIGLTSVSAGELFDSEEAKQQFNAGLDLYYKKDYPNAIKKFEEAAQIDPENANAYYFMGYAYYKLKNMKKAIEVFDQAYEVDAKYSPLKNAPADEAPQNGE